MFKVSATNSLSGIMYEGIFETETMAVEWKNSMLSSGQWGNYENVSVVISDITSQIEEQNRIKLVELDVMSGDKIKKKISAIMRAKLSAGEITLEQMAEFVEREAVKKVERYLGEGYLQLAKAIILSVEFDPITTEEKNNIVSEL